MAPKLLSRTPVPYTMLTCIIEYLLLFLKNTVFFNRREETMNTLSVRFTRSSNLAPSVWSRLEAGSRLAAAKVVRPLLFVALFILIAGCSPKGGGDAVLVVDSNHDDGDDNPGDGICHTSLIVGRCTLRAAIEEANATEGSHTIEFNLADHDLSIRPLTTLPVITGELTIDGETQPGFTDDPIVVVHGMDLTLPSNVLETAAGSEVTIRGLQVLQSFRRGINAKGNITLQNVIASDHDDYGFFAYGETGVTTVQIYDSEFSGNEGTGFGANNTNLVILRAMVSGNHHGGISVAGGSLDLQNSTIEDNSNPSAGGGISIVGSTQASLSTVDILNNTATDVGGGVRFQGDAASTLRLEGCDVSRNIAAQGGGLYTLGGSVTLGMFNTLFSNRADSGGGGIYVNGGWLEVDESDIGEVGNGNNPDADGDGSGAGGGIYNHGGDLLLRMAHINGNAGSGLYSLGGNVQLHVSDVADNGWHGVELIADGGAMEFSSAMSLYRHNAMNGVFGENVDMFFVDDVFWENGAQGLRMEGGTLSFWRNTVRENRGNGIYLNGVSAADIKQTAIWGNTASGAGGGLLITGDPGGSYAFENVTIHGNSAGPSGGGLELSAGTATLNNATITENTARDGGGIHSTGTVEIRNSIIAENPGNNCSGTVTSLGYNIANSGSCPLYAVGDQINTAVTLGPLQHNGGPNFTRAISSSSDAFDAGDDATCAAVDQRDVARPQAMHCDVGAFELEARGKSESATNTPTLEITPIPTPASIVFDPVEFSADKIFQGGKTCDPMALTVKVRVTPADLVHSLALYYRVVGKDGTGASAWDGGLKMERLGDGWYQLALSGNDLPKIPTGQAEAWLDIQFVANDASYLPIARSVVFRQVTLQRCFN
jgi:CSLREA domain-containing protein